MKTSKFNKLVEELGYEVVDNIEDIIVRNNFNIFARVDAYSINRLDTYWEEDIPNELFDILVEYAKTPIEERKEDKKYYLKLPIGDPASSYLNRMENFGTFSFMSKSEAFHWKTQFTQEEIDKLPNQKFVQTLIKEEVECQS